MNKLDSFFDTFEKRISWLLLGYLLSALMISSMVFYLGIHLMQVNNYAQITQLLDLPLLEHLFIGRLAYALLAMPVLNIFQLLWSLFHVRFFEVVFGIGTLLFAFNQGKTKLEWQAKRVAKCQVWGYVFLCFVLLLGFIVGFQAGDLAEVMMILHTLGGLCCLVSGGLFLIIIVRCAHVIGGELPAAFEAKE